MVHNFTLYLFWHAYDPDLHFFWFSKHFCQMRDTSESRVIGSKLGQWYAEGPNDDIALPPSGRMD